MSEQTSVWDSLVEEWVARERRMHPDAPIKEDSVRVRDALEIHENAYVLVSYEIEYPWPQEEDAPGESRNHNTAVIQAARVKQPWIERDAARSLAQSHTDDGVMHVFEHPLGANHAFSGSVVGDYDKVVLEFSDGSQEQAAVVDGWFLCVISAPQRLTRVQALKGGDVTYDAVPQRDELNDMVDGMQFTRTAGSSMYFSPLDLRGVIPLVQWQRSGSIVVVAVSMEHYDEGGTLRLRIDGVRRDEDLLVSWPQVSLEIDGSPIASAICGEYFIGDTVMMDIAFKPWLPTGTKQLNARLEGLRTPRGPVEPLTLEVDLSSKGL